ncbi:hypothetical protein B0H15DRAFT_806614 [Mycena belliarum]|uniref:Uncharacterized protein n=1 Tax=Mycena belliarum TaxID=1033014 RepID=A0AAD6TT54_9AGAR|nr:hypothetical protein B0H15DRAFT_806614 [Mycena belliae]
MSSLGRVSGERKNRSYAKASALTPEYSAIVPRLWIPNKKQWSRRLELDLNIVTGPQNPAPSSRRGRETLAPILIEAVLCLALDTGYCLNTAPSQTFGLLSNLFHRNAVPQDPRHPRYHRVGGLSPFGPVLSRPKDAVRRRSEVGTPFGVIILLGSLKQFSKACLQTDGGWYASQRIQFIALLTVLSESDESQRREALSVPSAAECLEIVGLWICVFVANIPGTSIFLARRQASIYQSHKVEASIRIISKSSDSIPGDRAQKSDKATAV